MTKLKPGDAVAFSQSVLRLAPEAAPARGIVLSITRNIVRVDFRGTWIPHEDGSAVRHVPAGNLRRVLSSREA